MEKLVRLGLYVFLLLSLLLNMFVFNLQDGYYYIFNSFVFTTYVGVIFFLRHRFLEQSRTEKNIFKVILLISLIAFLGQIGSINFLYAYNYRDLSILIFSVINLIAFFVVVFLYEIRNT